MRTRRMTVRSVWAATNIPTLAEPSESPDFAWPVQDIPLFEAMVGHTVSEHMLQVTRAHHEVYAFELEIRLSFLEVA